MAVLKRIIAPILYFLFTFPVYFCTLMAFILYKKIFALHSVFGLSGDLESFIILIIFSVPFFYVGNVLMQKIEQGQQPKITDHLRQSIFQYVTLIYCAYLLLLGGFTWFTDCKVRAFLCTEYAVVGETVVVSLIAIAMNGFYLYRRYKILILKINKFNL
jgi:hypothetical protein